MGKSQRVKGATGEREVVGVLKLHGLAARRTAMMQTQSSCAAPDVSIDEMPWLWIEVKRGKAVSPRAAFEQGTREMLATPTTVRTPAMCLAVTRKDRGEWMAYGLERSIFSRRADPRIATFRQQLRGKMPRLDAGYAAAVFNCEAHQIPILSVAHIGTGEHLKAYMKFTDLLRLWGYEAEGR